MLDGVCLCYQFQRKALKAISAVLDEKEAAQGAAAAAAAAGSAVTNGTQCVFGPMYASCLRTNRRHRFAFLRNLLSLFEEKTARYV